MRNILLLIFVLFTGSGAAQIAGHIHDADGKALAGASVRFLKSKISGQTDRDGNFYFSSITLPDTLSVHFVGYRDSAIVLTSGIRNLSIRLPKTHKVLEEIQVINTGFYQLPKERATGAFTVLNNELLTRSVGGNILQRMEGIASGVQFVTPDGTKATDVRVRGLATIQSNASPLIVVDNFPYDGDITSINPNDVENITILKDAAAASIWGARAGNGVIVISTKQGRYNQKSQLSLNSNISVGRKPDLLYSQNRLPSEIVMQIEKEKYERGGYYLENINQTPFPEYVEMLIALKNGSLGQEEFDRREAMMKQTEVRDEAMKFLYRPSVYQQYAINARGGGDKYTYFVSGGYDRNKANVIGNENDRINLNLQNTFKPFRHIEFTASMWYSQQKGANNGIELNEMKSSAAHMGLSPYIRLTDIAGNPSAVIKDYRQTYVDQPGSIGMLDWHYRPLAERGLIDRRNTSEELRVNTGVKLEFLDHFNINTTYQYVKGGSGNKVEYDKDSYYVRNLVNRFTQADGQRKIPYGGIFQEIFPMAYSNHSGRIQLNYAQDFNEDHQVIALGGSEIRQSVEITSPGYLIYDYNPDIWTGNTMYNYNENYALKPNGQSRIPAPSSLMKKNTDRYLSHFGNASYTYRKRYVISGSARWDGSNLFGVKANQKGTPLWSIGGSWELSKERWFRSTPIDYLRLRTTYGIAGNINQLVSAYPTVSHTTGDLMTGRSYAVLNTIGNPSLRWEQVKTLNLGLDFRTKNNLVNGSLEYYIKDGNNLIGEDILLPNTGVSTGSTAARSNLVNYASIRTSGLDLQINSHNLNGDFSWNSTFLLNIVRNKVRQYKVKAGTTIYNYLGAKPTPVVGTSLDVLYGVPQYKLSPVDGTSMLYIEDQQVKKVSDYFNKLPYDKLLNSGVSVSPLYGSIRNDFSWNGMSLSLLITGKFDYVFRRTTHSPGLEYSNVSSYHMDYMKRWQKAGDEIFTDIPATSKVSTENLSSNLKYFENFISDGDHIRLQDVRFSYTIPSNIFNSKSNRKASIYAYARNLGVIWKSTKLGIDPDYANAEYVAPKTFAVGINIEF